MSAKTKKKLRKVERAVVDAFLLKAMGGLRKMVGQDLKERRRRFPDHPLPCSTCAFRSSTDSWKGMNRTVAWLLGSLLSDQPFYCHVSPVTGKPFQIVEGEYGVAQARQAGESVSLCAAWSSICTRSQDEIIGIIADATADSAVPRPIDQELKEHILGFVDVFVKG